MTLPSDPSEEQAGDQLVIQPVDFTPARTSDKSARKRVRPLALLLIAALLASGVVLWFLLTAKSLVVQVEPESATVELDGLAFRLSDHFLLRSGEYQVSASAEGYKGAAETIRVGDADSQLMNLALEKLPGHLAIQSEPAGVEVLLDGELIGVTPLRYEAVSVGEHQLTLKKNRYLSSTQTLTIEGMDKIQQISVMLQPAWGSLTINSDPQGAAVSISAEERGVTPLSTELLAEGELVELMLEGYKSWQQQLAVPAGETLNAETIELQLADALLKLTTRPTNASVLVDGVFRGTTPLELAVTPGDTHRIRLFLDGYQRVERVVSLVSGAEQLIHAILPDRTGTLRIAVTPTDAEVLIDGVSKGRSGKTLQLPARAHRLEVRRKGFAPVVRTVTPRVGLEQVLQITLQTEAAARWASTPREIKTSAGQLLKLFRPQTSFTLGASRREAGRRANEVMRKVALERPFYLAQQTVTNKQFKLFNKKHTSSHASGQTLDTPRQPVISVSWQQAASYCNWLSQQQNLPPFYQQKDGKIVGIDEQSTGYRLPTEAEWAWAARYREGTMLKFPWGGRFPPAAAVGNYADISGSKILGRVLAQYRDGFVVSAPVSRFAANPKGLYDLGSNVSEWVNDFYGIELGLSLKQQVDPLGPEKGDYRVIKGASWRDSDITELRLSYRDYGLDGKDDIGFRVARYAN